MWTPQDIHVTLTGMMFFSFGQIFWGLVLIIVDININHFDILPDIIGYILVAIGCRGLTTESPRFSTAGTLSWVMVIIVLLGYAVRSNAGSWFGLVSAALDCTMMWFLLGGVMDLAASRQRMDLSERASNGRIAYVAIMAAATLLGLLAQGSPGATVFVALILVASALVLLFLILHLIHRVRREIAYDLI